MPKDLQHHFSQKERAFFEIIKPFLKPSDSVLKIGNGFGYLSTYIGAYVREIKIFEVNVFENTINKEQVTLYDGKVLPVGPKSFDVAVFNLVLHHIPNNIDYLRQVASKTRRSVILYEQTYDNVFQKIQLVWRDWYINKKAGSSSKIYWNSYFKRCDLEKNMSAAGMKIIHRETQKSHSYHKELLILAINS